MEELRVLHPEMLEGTPVISGLPNCSPEVPAIVIECQLESGFMASLVIPFMSSDSAEFARKRLFGQDTIKLFAEITGRDEE